MKRRQVLAGAAGALSVTLAGCADPKAVLTMTAISDEEIAARASASPPGRVSRRIIRTAVENGSATASGTRPPLGVDSPIAFDGAYYELSRSSTRIGDELRVTVKVDPGERAPDAATVAFGELPDPDRELLGRIVPPPEGREDAVGASAIYDGADREASALVPGAEYGAVERDGERFPFEVVGRDEVDAYEYRYEATQVAADAAAFADRLREAHLFELSGLSDAEREIVESAIGGGYYEGSVSDAFSSLADRFRDHDAVDPSDWGGEFLVRYEETDYWADLQHPPSDAD
ncbi:hypothetical protein SAMN06269185_1973 [Natronoarchaeum philippinense]|uniref:Uncharacterized protein n=1 Tax=Natronoarchaeum philippinense TaxID=558529 RepID=A0A285NTQ9_NATPI|nr:hypothetical protein [Natronoarchaeum philippinense]SNZ12892.1 hypothetical protein SAMN06269185_1973 [Natronoarchaeum philippinense]